MYRERERDRQTDRQAASTKHCMNGACNLTRAFIGYGADYTHTSIILLSRANARVCPCGSRAREPLRQQLMPLIWLSALVRRRWNRVPHSRRDTAIRVPPMVLLLKVVFLKYVYSFRRTLEQPLEQKSNKKKSLRGDSAHRMFGTDLSLCGTRGRSALHHQYLREPSVSIGACPSCPCNGRTSTVVTHRVSRSLRHTP